MSESFTKQFNILTGKAPFPWQARMYELFLQGTFPEICMLPTGLGKTSMIAIWLLALAKASAKIPRRLVYVVNRRTVVDQTTNEVDKLRKNLEQCDEVKNALSQLCATGVGKSALPLAISTLRGQSADNQEWSDDPARPAVICGTVDMIGSRLLFSAYGRGYKIKPMHAGFLGQDTLLIHDEAHLEPAFQELLEAVEQEQRTGRFPDARPLRIIALTATARGATERNASATLFKLDESDQAHETVAERLNAHKSLELHAVADDKKSLSKKLLELALVHKGSQQAILIFARTVETVFEVLDGLQKAKLNALTLTGTMRGYEREQLIEQPAFKRFLPEAEAAPETVYLVCTSAGEVGVNISADHLVCDLSTYDSMAQRFGRVNRFGDRADTRIDVVHPEGLPSDEEAARNPKLDVDARRRRTLELLNQLQKQASPAALGKLPPEDCLQAFAPSPVSLPTSDILFDAWALTSISGQLPGRPPVEPYLHGIAEWEPERTQVAWRDEIDVLSKVLGDGATVLEKHAKSIADLLENYPLKPHELLSDRSDRIFDQFLKKLAARKEFQEVPVWIIDRERTHSATTLQALVNAGKDEFKNIATLLLPPSAGGLSTQGLLDATSDLANDVAEQWLDEQDQPRRQRCWDDETPHKGMRWIDTIDTKPDADEYEKEDTEIPERRKWHWYERSDSADGDGSKSARVAIQWPMHTNDVVRNAQAIAQTLLAEQPDLAQALILAARFHDFGKRRAVWQRSIGNPELPTLYEKSGPKWKGLELTKYRHEFGSLLDIVDPTAADQAEFAAQYEEFTQLTPEQQDIVLHLIAVHHGWGRPHFAEPFDPERSQDRANEVAMEVPRRFARLQRRFGRWGLAWLESLLRAADHAASGNPSNTSIESEVST